MPSNAMKASQFVAQLQAEIATHGDLDMVFAIPGALVAIDGRNVNVTNEVQGQKLGTPAIVIGQYRDERGRLTNMPGQRYEVTADDAEWNYNRSEMRDNEVVTVWKRQGGQDRGYRNGEQYFVWEGRESGRPVEIVPAGILGWKP